MSVRIREARLDDLPAVFHLGERLFTSRDYPNLYRTWDEYEVIGLFQTSSETCFVAEDEETEAVVGFALCTTIEKRGSAWNYGHLAWLGVDEAHHGSGVAAQLVERFREAMEERGMRMLLVDTQEDNVRAIRFFEKMGFGNPVSHIYMTWNLAADTEEEDG